MSEKEKLGIGRELTDEELMEMTGGASFYIACQKNNECKPSNPVVMYGIITEPEIIAKYGIIPMYGIPADTIAKPLYGISVKPFTE